jgi:UDP-N-acetylmuramoyl-L-alanyl-D-glutamate--2,6-diaminopimelate ligase
MLARQKSRLDEVRRFYDDPLASSAEWISGTPTEVLITFPNVTSTLKARRPHVTQLSTSNAGVSLRALLAEEYCDVAATDVRATSCTSDWRHLRPGDVFVAIAEAVEDGHDYAAQAAQRGASALVCERPLPVFDVPQLVVSDSRVAYGRLCQALVGNPSRQMKVIGVTGTHGKTTVTRLLSSILRTAGASTGTLDSFGYYAGDEDHLPLGSALTAPVLARSLAHMGAAGTSHAVVEVSSRELSQQILAGVHLDAVCMTHIGRRHLDWHGSVENHRKATQRIFEYMHPDAIAILNADDTASVAVLSELNQPALTFGMKLPAEITAEIVEQYVNEQLFILSAGEDSVGVRTSLIGDHHVYNCLAAAAMALAYGIELPEIAHGLEAVDQLPGRMERVACGQDFAVLVDAADSPDALRVVLRAARSTTNGRVIGIYGSHDECDLSEYPAAGRVIGAMADVAAVTHGYPSDGSHRSCMELRTGFADSRKAQVILDRKEAIAWALNTARAGDTVVIAGMGERAHTPTEFDGELMNDSEIVKQLLWKRRTPMSHQRLAA